jgi:hypothetical protein
VVGRISAGYVSLEFNLLRPLLASWPFHFQENRLAVLHDKEVTWLFHRWEWSLSKSAMPSLSADDPFPVYGHRTRPEARRGRHHPRKTLRPVVAPARKNTHPRPILADEQTVAVIFDLVNPLRPRRYRLSQDLGGREG